MCVEKLRIASYSRVSYDEDKERYESIINQKRIVKDYVQEHFNDYEIIEYEDDNFSGYKFNRPAFLNMRHDIEAGKIDVVIAKDLSRIGRHNAKTLLFIEEMQQIDVIVIAINDDVDTSKEKENDLVGIKTWYNELYVKDTSRKIRSVVYNASKNGTWITNVPYGYVMLDYKKRLYKIDETAAPVVKKIFEMYVNGCGYKKIAKTLTEEKIVTPKTRMKQLWDELGRVYVGPISDIWNTASINHIIENDFYIGTLRTNKYSRRGINGIDKALPAEKQFVFENAHEPIISKKLFEQAQKEKETRGSEKSFYRGIKKYSNDYTGLMRCGDCGAPMFSISNGKRRPAYYCGSYHRNGRNSCTSHHVLVSVLDNLIKDYIEMIRQNSIQIVDYLDAELNKYRKDELNKNNKNLLKDLLKEEEKTKNELKVTTQQKIRDIMKNPNNREYIEDLYTTMENELNNKLSSIKSQIQMEKNNKSNDFNRNDLKKDALKILEDIKNKEKLSNSDLKTIIDCIYIYEDRIIIKLKSSFENILDIGSMVGISKNNIIVTQKNKFNHKEKKYYTHVKKGKNSSNIVKDGDPLEIFTDQNGEVVLKKYSPIGELSEFAGDYAETLSKTTGHIACITDKDTVIAVSGGSKKDFLEKTLSKEIEEVLENKEVFKSKENNEISLPITEGEGKQRIYNSQVVYPIISDGDVVGSVILLAKDASKQMGEPDFKVAQSAAGFLGSHLEI